MTTISTGGAIYSQVHADFITLSEILHYHFIYQLAGVHFLRVLVAETWCFYFKNFTENETQGSGYNDPVFVFFVF